MGHRHIKDILREMVTPPGIPASPETPPSAAWAAITGQILFYVFHSPRKATDDALTDDALRSMVIHAYQTIAQPLSPGSKPPENMPSYEEAEAHIMPRVREILAHPEVLADVNVISALHRTADSVARNEQMYVRSRPHTPDHPDYLDIAYGHSVSQARWANKARPPMIKPSLPPFQ